MVLEACYDWFHGVISVAEQLNKNENIESEEGTVPAKIEGGMIRNISQI